MAAPAGGSWLLLLLVGGVCAQWTPQNQVLNGNFEYSQLDVSAFSSIAGATAQTSITGPNTFAVIQDTSTAWQSAVTSACANVSDKSTVGSQFLALWTSPGNSTVWRATAGFAVWSNRYRFQFWSQGLSGASTTAARFRVSLGFVDNSYPNTTLPSRWTRALMPAAGGSILQRAEHPLLAKVKKSMQEPALADNKDIHAWWEDDEEEVEPDWARRVGCPCGLRSVYLSLMVSSWTAWTLYYVLLFGIWQSQSVTEQMLTDFGISQLISILLVQPGIAFVSVMWTFAVLPAWMPYVVWMPGVGRLFAGPHAAVAATSTERPIPATVLTGRLENLTLVRAAGAASMLPPDSAVVAYGVTAVISGIFHGLGIHAAKEEKDDGSAACGQPESAASIRQRAIEMQHKQELAVLSYTIERLLMAHARRVAREAEELQAAEKAALRAQREATFAAERAAAEAKAQDSSAVRATARAPASVFSLTALASSLMGGNSRAAQVKSTGVHTERAPSSSKLSSDSGSARKGILVIRTPSAVNVVAPAPALPEEASGTPSNRPQLRPQRKLSSAKKLGESPALASLATESVRPECGPQGGYPEGGPQGGYTTGTVHSGEEGPQTPTPVRLAPSLSRTIQAMRTSAQPERRRSSRTVSAAAAIGPPTSGGGGEGMRQATPEGYYDLMEFLEETKVDGATRSQSNERRNSSVRRHWRSYPHSSGTGCEEDGLPGER